MKKSYVLKYNYGDGYIGDGLGFCSKIFEQMFPRVACQDKVTIKVSDTRMKKKGEIKVSLCSRSVSRCSGISYKEQFIQITETSMMTISKDFSGDVYVIVS